MSLASVNQCQGIVIVNVCACFRVMELTDCVVCLFELHRALQVQEEKQRVLKAVSMRPADLFQPEILLNA